MVNASEFKQMSDEEIELWLERNFAVGGTNLAISELMRRSMKETRNYVIELKVAIEKFSASSEQYSNKIVWLTWTLVFLTVVLLIFTAFMVFK